MAPVTIPLAKQSNPGRNFGDGSGRLINCYVEPRGEEGRHQTPVYPVDGITLFASLPVQTTEEDEGYVLLQDGEILLAQDDSTFILEGNPFAAARSNPDKGIQELIEDHGALWAITGTGAYKIDQGGDTTFIGNIPGASVITAEKNRVNQIGIVSDSTYLVLDTLSEELIDYSDQLVQAPNSTCHYNGYTIVTYANSLWQWSSLNQATTWNANDTATAIFKGDLLRRCLTRAGDLLLFGDETLEFWTDANASNNAIMTRITAIDVGIGAPLSAINLDQAVLFVDNDYSVRVVQNYSTKIVSTSFISRTIRKAADRANIRATSYERDGHLFYSISCAQFTLTYNMATSLWHEEKTYGMDRRIVSVVEKMNGVYYAGNYREGTVYTLSNDIHKDGSDPLVMEVITPPVHAFPNRVRVKSLYIDALFGTALAADVTDDESNPKLSVWVSEDDGENFIFLEELSLGDINSKYEELRVQGVGTSDQNGFVFKLAISTPVVRGILGMSADVNPVRA